MTSEFLSPPIQPHAPELQTCLSTTFWIPTWMSHDKSAPCPFSPAAYAPSSSLPLSQLLALPRTKIPTGETPGASSAPPASPFLLPPSQRRAIPMLYLLTVSESSAPSSFHHHCLFSISSSIQQYTGAEITVKRFQQHKSSMITAFQCPTSSLLLGHSDTLLSASTHSPHSTQSAFSKLKQTLSFRGQQTFSVKGQLENMQGFWAICSLPQLLNSALSSYKNSHRQYVNEWERPCSNVSFTKIGSRPDGIHGL